MTTMPTQTSFHSSRTKGRRTPPGPPQATETPTARDSLAPTRPRHGSDIEFDFAKNRSELSAAFRLVYSNYVDSGLIEPNDHQLRVTPYHFLPTTQVFVAKRGAEVVCAVSLVGDGDYGIPMESVYQEAVDAKRASGTTFAEVSCLAVGNLASRQFLPAFVGLTRLMAQFARTNGIDELLIAVHPKHSRFYKRYIGFEQIGERRAYPTVQNRPAVACCLNFERFDRERPDLWPSFFGTPIAPERLSPNDVTGNMEQFRPAAESFDCWRPVAMA